MKGFFKIIVYTIYMVFVRLKGIKYGFLRKFKGIDAATEYSGRVLYYWSKFTVNIIGIDLEIIGKDNIPKEPCVFIGNHTSILDIPVLAYSAERSIGFIAKSELLKAPFIGYWLKRGSSVALDRDNPRDAIRVINEGVTNIKNGLSMAIFPEGTRSKDGKVMEFKKGSLKLATKAKAPIVPVTIDGAYKSYEKDKKFQPSKIVITFGKAIPTDTLSREEEKLLTDKVRDIVISNLK